VCDGALIPLPGAAVAKRACMVQKPIRRLTF
jgi:hypothetical protein